jgi:hypothetical protein
MTEGRFIIPSSFSDRHNKHTMEHQMNDVQNVVLIFTKETGHNSIHALNVFTARDMVPRWDDIHKWKSTTQSEGCLLHSLRFTASDFPALRSIDGDTSANLLGLYEIIRLRKRDTIPFEEQSKNFKYKLNRPHSKIKATGSYRPAEYW